MRTSMKTWLVAAVVGLGACGAPEAALQGGVDADAEAVSFSAAGDVSSQEKAFSSDQATLLNFEFEASFVVASAPWNVRQAAQDQLLYTIGHLNGERSVGRLDTAELSAFKQETLASGETRVSYRAKLPVAWASKTNFPATYEFKLPKRADYQGYEAFTSKYATKCIDWSAHDVDSGSMWYYYRPKQCTLDADDVIVTTATVSVSNENSSNKYPEYHKVWEDGRLDVVAIFGKYEDNATTSADAGIAAYNEFVSAMRRTYGAKLQMVPADAGNSPGVAKPDVQMNLTLDDGRIFTVTALLVDNVRTAPASFDTRYNALSGNADVIAYNGHAGLGSNVRALVRKGTFIAGKYQIFFMNGCDTFAYVDGFLAQTKMALNPDDTTGTKYLDFVTNAMPSYFHANSENMLALIGGLWNKAAPKTYDQIFKQFDRSQVVVSTGEEDNVYFPGYDPDAPVEPTTWGGATETKTVARAEQWSFKTPLLPAGSYEFTIAQAPNTTGGDADLYVRVGTAPTKTVYDCRPYKGSSNELCTVTLAAPAEVFVMVDGYSAQPSAFVFTGRAK